MKESKSENYKMTLAEWQAKHQKHALAVSTFRGVMVGVIALVAVLAYFSAAEMREDQWVLKAVGEEQAIVLEHPAHGERVVHLCGLTLQPEARASLEEYIGQTVGISFVLMFEGMRKVYLYSPKGELINEQLLIHGLAHEAEEYTHPLSPWFKRLSLRHKK